MQRVCVFILVCLTGLAVAHVVKEDATSDDSSINDGRYKRQAEEPSTPKDENKPNRKPHHRHHKFMCCDKMPMVFDWNIIKSCMSFGGHRHGPPRHGPGGHGPPPPGGHGPPPPGGHGPPTPPPPPEESAPNPDDGVEEPEADNPGLPEKLEEESTGPKGHGRGGRDKFREYMECEMECVFGKINAINDGAVDLKVFEDYVVNKFKDNPDDTWKDVAVNAINSCSETYNTEIDQEQKCKSGAAKLSKCMYKQMFKNCPSSYWQDTEECNACRESEEKCWFKKGGKWKGKKQ